MRRLTTILGQRRGESLVELMAATVIFLMLMATLHGAVRFSSNALQKAESIRANTSALQAGLREAGTTATGGTAVTITFQAVSADGTQAGGDVLFKVPVKLQTKTVTGADGGQVEFRVFGENPPPIGGWP